MNVFKVQVGRPQKGPQGVQYKPEVHMQVALKEIASRLKV